MGTCLGRDSHGASTCLKLATITTFSNGSKLESSVVDVYGWPDSLEFSPMAPYSAGSIGCYYDSATDSLIAMPVFRSNDPALVRVGPLASAQCVTILFMRWRRMHPPPPPSAALTRNHTRPRSISKKLGQGCVLLLLLLLPHDAGTPPML